MDKPSESTPISAEALAYRYLQLADEEEDTATTEAIQAVGYALLALIAQLRRAEARQEGRTP